jgi:hypothetical protein
MLKSARVPFLSGCLVASVLAVAAPATARATKYNADVMQLCDLAVAHRRPLEVRAGTATTK